MIEKVNRPPMPQVEQPKTSEPGFAKQFDACLEKALDKAPEGTKVHTDVTPIPLGQLHQVTPAATPGDLVPMEKTLDLMDRLATALNDPRSTARSLSPLIRNLDRQASSLIAGAGLLPEGDGAKSLMEQTALAAKIQVTKYQRGDFN